MTQSKEISIHLDRSDYRRYKNDIAVGMTRLDLSIPIVRTNIQGNIFKTNYVLTNISVVDENFTELTFVIDG